MFTTKRGIFFNTYILNAPKILYEWLYLYVRINPIIERLGVKIWNTDP